MFGSEANSKIAALEIALEKYTAKVTALEAMIKEVSRDCPSIEDVYEVSWSRLSSVSTKLGDDDDDGDTDFYSVISEDESDIDDLEGFNYDGYGGDLVPFGKEHFLERIERLSQDPWYGDDGGHVVCEPSQAPEILDLAGTWRDTSCKTGSGILRKIKMTVDSGAAVPVMDPETVPEYELIPPEREVFYRHAAGGRVRDEGSRAIQAILKTNRGGKLKAKLKFRLARVAKTLAAVSALVDVGNRVVFDEESYIYNKKARCKTPFTRENGIYVLEVWVVDPLDPPLSSVQKSKLKAKTVSWTDGFQRRG